MPWVHFIFIIITSTNIINIILVISIVFNNYSHIYQGLYSFEIFLMLFILRNHNGYFPCFVTAVSQKKIFLTKFVRFFVFAILITLQLMAK